MRKWSWLIVLILWIGVLNYPWSGLPPLQQFLLYPTTPLQIEHSDETIDIEGSPYPSLYLRYDDRGVAHVFANNEFAMAYGMGYTHAKDRLFQVEMLRRTVRGRLSEVVGARALPSDRWWLKFDFEAQAMAQYEALEESDPKMKLQFDAYAEGFNAYLATLDPAQRPLEYQLLGFEPKPMEAHTPILLVRYMDKVLDYREDDLKFSALQKYLPDSLIDLYYPWASDYNYPIYPEISGTELTAAAYSDAPEAYTADSDFPGAYITDHNRQDLGSNNWAISAEKSATGNAFLCNDTHLALDLPGTWYEVHQVIGDRVVHGLCVPGAPFIVSGYTKDLAWGMTNATWDLTDFYHLETDGKGNYMLDGNWTPLEARTVEIPVKGEKAVSITYYDTYFGPTDTIDGEFLATNWVASDFTKNEMKALKELSYSESLQEGYQALQGFGHPPQNFVLADRHGDIGMVTAGFAAMHSEPTRGIIEAKRSSDRQVFKHMGKTLYVLNPKKGWNHSANQHQVADSLSAYLSYMFTPTARGRRIGAMMEAREKIDRSYLKDMQYDVVDGEWPLLKDHIHKYAPYDMMKVLGDWDGTSDQKSQGATVYNYYKWMLHDTISELLVGDFDFKPRAENLFMMISQSDTLPGLDGPIYIAPIAEQLWKDVLEDMKNKFLSKEPNDWRYGDYHKITLRHIARIPAFNYDTLAGKGSNRTVNVSSGEPGTHGAAMRTVIELTPEGPKADFVIAGGQVGRPEHPNYSDQVDDWYNGQYFKVEFVKAPQEKQWKQAINFK
jgi:penicillin G amidase